MKLSPEAHRRPSLNTAVKKGAAFVLFSLAMFALLLLLHRPDWANPWLIASLFTFAVWRLDRPRRKLR